MTRKILILLITLLLLSCTNKDVVYEPTTRTDPYKIYDEAYNAFEKGDYFFAEKKFSEAELNFENIDLAAKSAIMSSYSLYGINLYTRALNNLERYLKKYPADKYVMYAHYLIAIIHYEQISDEKKDLQPLIDAGIKIDFFMKKYPDSDYSLDLKFKKDLIQNQLAAKEIYIAKFYIQTQKWIPAINRLKVVVKDYEETIFIEEALHRLVEIYYNLGLIEEAEKTAKILGYNYNSSKWYENSYALLNKDYQKKQKNLNKDLKKKEQGLVRKTIKKILNK